MTESQPVEEGRKRILDPLEEDVINFYDDFVSTLKNLPEYQEALANLEQEKEAMKKAGDPDSWIESYRPTLEFGRGYAVYYVYYYVQVRPTDQISICRRSESIEMQDVWIQIKDPRYYRVDFLRYNTPQPDGSMGIGPEPYDFFLEFRLARQFLEELKNPHTADEDEP